MCMPSHKAMGPPRGQRRSTGRGRNGANSLRNASAAVLFLLVVVCYVDYIALRTSFSSPRYLSPNRPIHPGANGPRDRRAQATVSAPAEPEVKWPSKLSFCTTGGWPSEVILTAEDAPIQVFVYEMEKVENKDKLSILVAAVSDEDDIATTRLLSKVLTSLRCDFRRGDVSQNAKRGPIHRSPVEISVLAEDEQKRGAVARITCDLPPAMVLKEKHTSLPESLDIADLDEQRRARQETHQWMHWQLSLPDLQSQTGTKYRSWIVSPSLPICNTTRTIPSVMPLLDRRPSADDYGPRGDTALEESSSPVKVGLCVSPPAFAKSTNEKWINSSIDEWIHYQRNIVGFSDIFYLDPFGEDLVIRHPELSSSLRSGMQHVPHMPVRTSMNGVFSEGSVAASLARERCSMLARQKHIQYILPTTDPMDLVVPLQRKMSFLPVALGSVVGKDCIESVQASSIAWFLGDQNGAGRACEEAWCNLADAVDPISSFLFSGKILFLDEASSSEFRFYNVLPMNEKSCRKMILHDNDLHLFRVLRNSPDKTPTNQLPPHRSRIESITQIIQSVAVWVRHDIGMAKKFKERVRKKRNMHSDSSWIPISPTDSTNLRFCRAFGDKGPQYGEAIVSRRNLSGVASRTSDVALRLSFYNAETVFSPITGLRVLSLSLYAESFESINLSLRKGWTTLYHSENLHELLPNMTCTYSHPDPAKMQRRLHTRCQWRTLSLPGDEAHVLTWLECPLPQELPLPGPRNLASQIIVAPTEPSNIDFRMTRPVSLCFGAEPMGKRCDEISAACKVGCIDDLKPNTDPQAQCCSRCHEEHHSYQRFDERDTWTPEVAAISVREPLRHLNSGAHHPKELPNTEHAISNPSGDLSVCLRPFYTESMSRDKDNIDPPTPQRMVEWLEYHLLIGFDIVYVLDRYGTALLPLLEPYVSSGRVIHIPSTLQSDVPFSSKARSGQSRLVPSAHDQVMAYDRCLSIARQRNDYFTAFIDLDEFIRYPQAEAGRLRRSIKELLSNQTEVPDQIYLERFDIETEPSGFALRNVNRFVKPRYEMKRNGDGKWTKRAHGKVLMNPHALVYGGVMVHFSLISGDGAVTSVANSDTLSISHYRPYNYEKELGDMQRGAKREDNSLQWAHDILSTQFIASAGWRGMESLSRQGLLRLESIRRSFRRNSSRAQALASYADTCDLLFIGILSYCADRDRRESIRQTWLSSEVLKAAETVLEVKWKFVLGQKPASEQSQYCQGAALAAEAEEFGDLLFLPDLPESYQVLTRKTLAMFKWANDNIDADFVLKTDDDSYVNILAFASDLQQVESSSRPLYWGNHQKLSPWLTSNFDLAPKWYTSPEDYPEGVQTYATGAGYLLSRPLVRHLAKVSRQNDTIHIPWGPEDRMGWLEDASVGYLLGGAVGRAGRVKAYGVSDAWFWYTQCNSVHFVVHHLNASQQLELHPLLFPVRDLAGASCEQFRGFKKEMPKVKGGARATGTQWGGSILDRPVSPSVAAPPPSDNRHLSLGNGRDVLVVTGGTHNIGRHLVDKIQEGYSQMSPLTILVFGAAKRETIDTSTDVHFMGIQTIVRKVDITNYELLLSELTAYQGRIRGVVHLAAVSRVQDCHSNVTRCKGVNVEGTKNILDALWTMYGKAAATSDSSVHPGKTPLPWLVFASSREVYGALSRGEVATETSPLRPLNIYGETKLQAEEAIRHWAVKTGFNAIVVRFTNVYGSCNDHQSRLVPNLLLKLSSNRRFDIFGSADKTISLLHVQDAVQALLLSINYAGTLPNGAGYVEPFNIGGGPDHDALNMKDIVRIAQSSVALASPNNRCKFCHQSVESRVLTTNTKDRSPEPEHFQASIDKAFRVLGYQPSKTFGTESVSQYLKNCVFLAPF